MNSRASGVRLPAWSRAPAPPNPAWPQRLAVAAGICAVAGGVLTLIGWGFDLPRLTDLRNDGISMFPNTAMCAVASGLGLLVSGFPDRRWRALTPVLGSAVALVGGLTFVAHMSG